MELEDKKATYDTPGHGTTPDVGEIRVSQPSESDARLRTQQRRFGLLADIARQLLTCESSAELLERVFSQIAKELDVQVFTNYLASEAGDRLELESSGGLTDQQKLDLSGLRFGELLCGYVAQTRSSHVFARLPEVTLPQAHGAIKMGLKAYAGFPLIADNRLLGTIAFASYAREQFELHDVELMQAVADLVAAAVERHRLTLSIRSSNAKLRQWADAFENCAHGIAIGLPGVNQILACNPAYARLMRRKMSDIIGMSYIEMYPPEERSRLLEVIAEADRVGHARFESRFNRPDGSMFFGSVEIVSVFDGDRMPIYRVVAFQDITERKEAELSLRLSEERLRLFIEQAPIALAMFDREMRYLTVSRRWLVDFNLQDRDIIGKKHYDIFPRLKESWKVAHQKGLAGEVVECDDDLYILEDGTELALRWKVHPWFENSNQVGGILVFIEDITERINAQKSLADEVSRSAMLREQLPDGIVILDPATAQILEFNFAAHRQLGYSREEFAKLTVRDLEMMESPEEIKQRIESVISKGYVEFETLHRSKTNQIRNVHVTAQIVNVMGKPIYQAIWRDITDRKVMEAQLAQAQKMEAIGQLAGGVAHDFRNQLTVIQGYVELLQDPATPAKDAAEIIAEIQKAIDRSSHLTSQLLIFGRRESLKPVSADLNAIITDLTRTLPRIIGEDVEVTLQCTAQPCISTIDVPRMNQALLNLINNARQAMPAGGKLTLATEIVSGKDPSIRNVEEDMADSYVVISIQDTGCGMDEHTQSHLFEPFFTTKPVGQGTGLGLAMVYGFIKQSNGFIKVKSAKGKGAEFRLYLPRATSLVLQPEELTKSPLRMTGDETILLVEDEEAIRKILHTYLSRAGYSVKSANSAAVAIELVRDKKIVPNLLITDVVMPGQSGLELAIELRKQFPKMPVLFTSGYAPKDLIDRGMTDLPNRILIKPFGLSDLAESVRLALIDQD